MPAKDDKVSKEEGADDAGEDVRKEEEPEVVIEVWSEADKKANLRSNESYVIRADRFGGPSQSYVIGASAPPRVM